MKDVANPAVIKLKGLLFLLLGLMASTGLLLDRHDARTIALLALAIWSFCRFYYFAFYVIERYVDASYKFSGLASLVRYLMVRSR